MRMFNLIVALINCVVAGICAASGSVFLMALNIACAVWNLCLFFEQRNGGF